jgi:hypothetical protein
MDEFIYSIDLDADYQREKIWSTAEQRLLLDSILQEIDIPKLYLAKVSNNKQFEYECIDGKQRMTALSNFYGLNETSDVKPSLTLLFLNQEYTYQNLKSDHPKIAEKIDSYKLDFVSYDMDAFEDEEAADRLIRNIFRRLQLGIRLNSGERLNALPGAMRDFVFKEMGHEAPFLRNTGIPSKRFARQFTLSQVCINSFKRAEIGDFVRARLVDLEDFFGEYENLDRDDVNLSRMRNVLQLMDDAFGPSASNISSKAVAVSAYLFVESLYIQKDIELIPNFVVFYLGLLDEIRKNMEVVRKFKSAENGLVMEQFQKYILQASVEPSSIRRRNEFLKKAFAYFMDPATRGKVIGTR